MCPLKDAGIEISEGGEVSAGSFTSHRQGEQFGVTLGTQNYSARGKAKKPGPA
jgi:hypothetical protein